jgi:hypothetical protein
LPRLCTFDFMQYSYEMYSSALSISFLFLFHYHIYFHLYILTYTYPFNLQSQKRIKKVLYSWVLNWVTKIVNYFSSFGPKKKKKIRNTQTRMNPSRSVLPEAQRVDHLLCGLRILIFKPVHCGVGCGKHANSAQFGPRPPLLATYFFRGLLLHNIIKLTASRACPPRTCPLV